MAISSIDNLQVFRESLEAAHAISALIQRREFASNCTLRDQLSSASSGVCAQIAEGYGQLTDRHFAHYLSIARGSCNEIQAHLAVAHGRRLLSENEWVGLSDRYLRIGKRLTRLIQHLRREDRRERG